MFTYTKITNFILFTNTTFNEGLDLSLALITGNITYFNSKILSFKNHYISEEKYNEAVEETGNIPIINKLETFRILKKHSKSNENNIQQLKFSKYELEAYNQTLKNSKDNFVDSKLIFILNKISNNHNTSWILGVFFTVITSVIFFNLAILFSSNYCFLFEENCITHPDVLKDYFTFLIPTHKNSDLKIKANSTVPVLFYLVDILGRIFIGYGIYQTIQAFRKYK